MRPIFVGITLLKGRGAILIRPENNVFRKKKDLIAKSILSSLARKHLKKYHQFNHDARGRPAAVAPRGPFSIRLDSDNI